MSAMPHEIEMAERLVYTKDYAGRFDRVGKTETDRWLIDFKTSSGLYDETGLQLSAYKNARFMEPNPGESGIPLDLTNVKLLGVQLGVDGLFSTREYPDNHGVFLSCLEIYRWKNV